MNSRQDYTQSGQPYSRHLRLISLMTSFSSAHTRDPLYSSSKQPPTSSHQQIINLLLLILYFTRSNFHHTIPYSRPIPEYTSQMSPIPNLPHAACDLIPLFTCATYDYSHRNWSTLTLSNLSYWQLFLSHTTEKLEPLSLASVLIHTSPRTSTNLLTLQLTRHHYSHFSQLPSIHQHTSIPQFSTTTIS